jgi:hypothetical protein
MTRHPAGLRVGALLAALLAGCAVVGAPAASDAPEARIRSPRTGPEPGSYAEALRLWRTPEEVNAWIGERFEYSHARALQLSETQRLRNGGLTIPAADAFFAAPNGVCVDLSRFAVDTLRAIDPGTRPSFLMIEFDPVTIAGNTLRRHWVATFRRDGQLWVFADSKRPGHLAGPYPDTKAFIAEYARYRGRAIVAHQERASHERTLRRAAARQDRDAQP